MYLMFITGSKRMASKTQYNKFHSFLLVIHLYAIAAQRVLVQATHKHPPIIYPHREEL